MDAEGSPVVLRTGVLLAEFTTIGIGGPARAFVEVDSESDLVATLLWLRISRRRHLVLGSGSNLLIDSAGYDGIVIRNRVDWIQPYSEGIEAAAGTPLQGVLGAALEARLGGIEFLSGIPGTLGGAISGNAGAYGASIGQVLQEARLLAADGRVRVIGPEALGFGYRRCQLQRSGDVLLSARLRLRPAADPGASRRRCEEILAERAAKHPLLPSAGSYFKNLESFDENGVRVPAGRLLDQAGCRGLTVGGAQVFERHANIIVNRGGATSSHVLELASEMRRRVLERFGIELEPEVRYLPRCEVD